MSAVHHQSERSLLAAFMIALEGLKVGLDKENIDVSSLHQHFLAVQQLYQQQLLPTLIASPSSTSFITYQTEINRTFRLLGIDVTFLQTAKDAMVVQKRQVKIQQRLQTLLDFSRGLEQQLENLHPVTDNEEISLSD